MSTLKENGAMQDLVRKVNIEKCKAEDNGWSMLEDSGREGIGLKLHEEANGPVSKLLSFIEVCFGAKSTGRTAPVVPVNDARSTNTNNADEVKEINQIEIKSGQSAVGKRNLDFFM